MAKKPTKRKGVARTPPFPAYEEWSTARFWSFIRSALRSRQLRWPPRNSAKMKARRKYEGSNKRQKFEYQCSECKNWFPDKEVEMDHIVEVGSLKDFQDLPGFVERLFCEESGWRVCCKRCHKQITQEQRKDKKEVDPKE